MSGCDSVSDYIKTQRVRLSLASLSIDILSTKSPVDKITENIHLTMSATSSDTISLSPLFHLGKDFISEQITKNGQQIINNATGAIKQELDKIAKFDVRKTIEEAQKQIYNSIAAAITADPDLSMIFLQRVAQKAVDALNDKKSCLLDLSKKVTELHNLLKIMVTGGIFFDPYLEKLRSGLKKIRSAQKNIDVVTSIYTIRKTFLKNEFNSAKSDLIEAEKLISPEKIPSTIPEIGRSILTNVGLPSQPEQLSALMSVPQKAQEVAFLATRYFLLTLQVNALLLAFVTGYKAFTGSASKLLDNYSKSMLESLSVKLKNLFEKMATAINGDPAALDKKDYAVSTVRATVSSTEENFIELTNPPLSDEAIKLREKLKIPIFPSERIPKVTKISIKPNSIIKVSIGNDVVIGQQLAEYRPDQIKVATQTLGWVLELRSIIDYMELIPGSTLSAIQASVSIVDVYNSSVEKIKTKNNRAIGLVSLKATEGREDVTDLKEQLQELTLTSLRAITNVTDGPKATSLAKTIIARIGLSISQDTEIIAILQSFIDTKASLKTTLPGVASSIKTALKGAGLDRASDLLDNGGFDEFFNLNSKTATYAGAALVGIASLKKCLSNTEDQEQLTQAERVIQRDVKAKELLTQRTTTSGFLQQKASIAKQDQNLSIIESKAKNSCAKCGIIDEFSVDGLLRTVSNVMGLSMQGNSTLPNDLANTGKGII